MESYLKEALEIVKAQASVRTMTEEEITTMVRKLAGGLRKLVQAVPLKMTLHVRRLILKKQLRKNPLHALSVESHLKY